MMMLKFTYQRVRDEMEIEWLDISEIEKFREYYEFNSYAVLVSDLDDDGAASGTYTDIAFGIDLIPKGTLRFCLIPHDELTGE
jgi:hypothetical protein